MTDKCIACRFFNRDGARPGKRPGVRDNYRRCTSPRDNKETPDYWTSPTNWCDNFDETPETPSPHYEKERHEPSRSDPRDDQIEMTLDDGFKFMADAPMVALITALNEAGIRTYSHCAGHTPDAPAWVVLDVDNLHIEVRPARPATEKSNGTHAQVILRWAPSWNKDAD